MKSIGSARGAWRASFMPIDLRRAHLVNWTPKGRKMWHMVRVATAYLQRHAQRRRL